MALRAQSSFLFPDLLSDGGIGAAGVDGEVKADDRPGPWRLGGRIELERRDRSAAEVGLHSIRAAYALPNPLRGLASDAATIATFVKSIQSPVILVGHSYGGAVISVAAASDRNVKALVYVDAFAPDEGESPLSLLASYPPPPKDFFTPVPFGAGGDADVYLAQKYYGPVFASDVPPATAAVMAVAQRPLTGSALNEKAPAAEGWKTIPSRYVVGMPTMSFRRLCK